MSKNHFISFIFGFSYCYFTSDKDDIKIIIRWYRVSLYLSLRFVWITITLFFSHFWQLNFLAKFNLEIQTKLYFTFSRLNHIFIALSHQRSNLVLYQKGKNHPGTTCLFKLPSTQSPLLHPHSGRNGPSDYSVAPIKL